MVTVSYLLDCSIFIVFLTVKNSSQILLVILLLLYNDSPIGWCRLSVDLLNKQLQNTDSNKDK